MKHGVKCVGRDFATGFLKPSVFCNGWPCDVDSNPQHQFGCPSLAAPLKQQASCLPPTLRFIRVQEHIVRPFQAHVVRGGTP